jgi:hypothetical protein
MPIPEPPACRTVKRRKVAAIRLACTLATPDEIEGGVFYENYEQYQKGQAA